MNTYNNQYLKKEESSNRITVIDVIRSLAVYFMLVFHFSYDLNMFGYNKINFQIGFWYWFPRLIVFMFLYCVGYTLAMNYSQQLQWPKFLKRLYKIAGYAAIVSVVTYFLFPANWIYFGTLHCIATCSLLSVPFLNRPKVSLITAGLIIASVFYFDITYKKLSSIIAIKSMDFIPFYPWFFVVLLAIAQFHYFPWRIKFRPPKFLTWPGQESLKIYLLHQPLFFGTIWIFFRLTR
jgi:uncharacterized membrane protein